MSNNTPPLTELQIPATVTMLVFGFVRVSSGELNVSLISCHVAVCTASPVMTTNDTIYTAGHVYSISVQFLANVNSRSRSLYAIARPSVVCRR